MSISIENCGIFKYGSNAILRFGVKSIQDNKSDIVFKSTHKIFEDEPIDVFIPNKEYQQNFKKYMKETPVTTSEISMYDFYGNNIGKYLAERTSNNDGGNIEIQFEDITFLHEVVEKTSGNSIIYLNDYYPLNKLDKSIMKQFIQQDFEAISCIENCSNVVLVTSDTIYSKINSCLKDSIDMHFKGVITVEEKNFDENFSRTMVKFSLQRIFGKVIKGKPSNISSFIKIEGGVLDDVIVESTNCNISHRTDNRVQFTSNMNEAEASVICFLVAVEDNIKMTSTDNIEGFIDKDITNKLNISITPNLDIMFYHRLFNLKNLMGLFKNSDNIKTLIDNGSMVMDFMLNRMNLKEDEMNVTEKTLLKYYKNMVHNLKRVFNSENEQPILPSRLGKYTNDYLTRQVSCAKY